MCIDLALDWSIDPTTSLTVPLCLNNHACLWQTVLELVRAVMWSLHKYFNSLKNLWRGSHNKAQWWKHHGVDMLVRDRNKFSSKPKTSKKRAAYERAKPDNWATPQHVSRSICGLIHSSVFLENVILVILKLTIIGLSVKSSLGMF